MKKKILIGVTILSVAAAGLLSCNKGGQSSKTGTGLAVEKASAMSLSELEQASKKEWEENPNGKMKVVGLTSVLRSVATSVAAKYEWLDYDYNDGNPTGNIVVDNSYKDYALITALNTASTGYFADYALAQDVRSFATMIEDGITHNFTPSDLSTLGVPEEGALPLYGVHFNKLFWTNTNFEHVNGFKLYNIWQVAGSEDDEDHCTKLSFQSPTTEQINMSFLVTAYAEENQKRIEDAYQAFYGKAWEPSGVYTNAGQQWVAEFIANISRFHTSDGTAMKETQLKSEWDAGYVYYGAFAKMKDAVGKTYNVDLNGNGVIEDEINLQLQCGSKTYTYASEKAVNAMSTVKWDWDIEGFNGFMYCMDSQIVNNAKYPYTACLFARTMLEEEVYTTAIYNAKNPDEHGDPANQYGYYYPGQASNDFRYAAGDWTKEQHTAKELNESYSYLKRVRPSVINNIMVMVNSNTKSKS